MNHKMLVPALSVGLLLLSACSSYKGKENKKTEEEATAAKVMPLTMEGVTTITATWPEASKAAVNAMNAKYGMPVSASEDMIVWSNTAPFKRTIVYKEEITHLFPMEHKDILLQVVDYRVPLDKIAALARFDGSLIVDRTKGELATRNETEEMNILALNLADKIVKGEMTVESARREYSKSAEAFAAGTTSPMITSLNFTSSGDTSDPDVMMQSQTKEQPAVHKTEEAEEYKKIIEEEN
ncbi:MAG: hypothetical protein NDI69_06960 [Bacteriovoracaceae bacterium]|nr:hypothetical protein [Bacteriovoracaceae bacterium]